VQDVMFYIRFPKEVKNPRVLFGSGFYKDALTYNIWSILSPWSIINVWSLPNSVLDEHPLMKHAILTMATTMYQDRELTSDRQRSNIPSILEHVMRPLRRPPGY
jgi:hypothetical protein